MANHNRMTEWQRKFGWVSDEERLRNHGDGFGNLEEKLDGLQRTRDIDGSPFNRAEAKRIITGEQVGSKGVYVDNRGIAHKTKRERDAANRGIAHKTKRERDAAIKKLGNLRWSYGGPSSVAIGGSGVALSYADEPRRRDGTHRLTFEEAYAAAKVDIALAEFVEMQKQATMVSRAVEIGSAPPFAFVSFSFSRPWYQRVFRKVGDFFGRLGN